MAQTWKPVRIFISSTFRDMHAERDYLVRFVFPELRERCAKRRLHLVDVDLRWGVTEEEAERGKVLEICLDEIERCRPFFIGLLSERYGWVPPKYDVPDEPRYDWVREFKPGHSITALEIYHGILRNPEMVMRAFFYFRDPAFLSDVPEEHRTVFEPESEEATEKLKRLKEDIRQQCPVFDYPCAYGSIGEDGKVTLTGLEAFGQRVLEDLWSAITQEHPEEEAPREELAVERAYHETFIENRSRRFIGRRDLLQQMSAHANGDDAVPLVVTGSPGCGKSALLANFAREYAEAHEDTFVLPHFIGVSPGSTDIRRTLLRLCRELARRFEITDEIPEDYEELRKVFPNFLEQAASHGKVVLLLDGLNQLDETYRAHTLDWLPWTLPPEVRPIVSTQEGDCLDALRRRRPAPPEITIGPLPLEGRKEIVRHTLWDYRKRLDERPENDQMGELLGKGESDNPLYLIVACEELRVFGEFERVTERIVSLPEDVPFLFEQVLERLEDDHGGELVKDALSLLECSRHGLLETEMLELLQRGGKEQLPRAIWARLYRSLQFYLRPPGERGEGALDFFHRQLANAVRTRYLDDEACQRRHQALANYFGKRGCDYPRTLSELAYHRYQSALVSGDCQHLFELVDDVTFRRRQFEFFGRPEPIAEEIDYAVDLAVRHLSPVQVIHYSMMRVDVITEVFRTDLYRLITIAKDHPQRAQEVISLIPDLTLRRMALILLAWLLREDEGERGFVHDLIIDASSISVPASVSQVPVLLEMIKELYCAGLEEARELVRAIPSCPVRQIYQTAWGSGQERTKALAIEMMKTATSVPEAPAEEIDDFNKAQEFTRKSEGQLRRRIRPEVFEEQLIELLGPSKASGVYFLIAANEIHAGSFDTAALLTNRGIFVSSSLQIPGIRTLSALVELFGETGNRDLAEEHADRVRTVARTFQRIAKPEYDLGRFQDALSDLGIATDNLARTWRPSGAKALLERSLAGQRTPGAEGEPDTLARLVNARQLLARGHVKPVPEILRDILKGLGSGEEGVQLEAILISIYVMARSCKDEALATDCTARLQEHNLHPEALYLPGDRTRHSLAVLETLVNSDPRYVASVSLCLRLEGLDSQLLEFAQIASNAGADVETLDAILSQVVRMPGIEPVDLQRVSEDIVGTTVKSLDIPSGLGWYYYPGIMLWAAWAGIVFASIGFGAALTIPKLFTSGMLFAVAGLIGGSLDLVIWRFIHLWERPEVSRRLLLPELASLASPWLTLLLIRPWLEAMDRTSVGVGMLVAFVLSSLPGIIMWREGLLFTPLSTKLVALGTAISLIFAGLLGTLLPALAGNLVSPSVFGGMFLVGMLEIAVCLSIIPKRVAVARHYRAGASEHKSICS